MRLAGDSGALLGDLARFARGRALGIGLLVLAGSVLEMGGILLLVPVVQILIGGEGDLQAAAAGLLSGIGLSTPHAQVGAVLVVFAVLIAVRFVVLMKRETETERLRAEFVADLRSRAFRSLAGLPWTDLAGRGHGRIGHALARDVDRVSDTVGTVIGGVLSLLHLAVQLALALVLAPVIAMGVILLSAASYRAVRGLRRRAAEHGATLTQADFTLFDTTNTYLRGLKPARAHGLEHAYATAFSAAARRLARELAREQRDYALARHALQAMVGATGLAAIAAGVFLFPIAPERLIVVILILARLSGPIQFLQAAAQYTGHASAAYRSLRELTGGAESAAAPPPAAQPRPLDRAPGIRFRDVSFAGSEAELLASVNCEVPAGRVTALTGHSGAGKSLFCDLAIGLLQPQRGTVELDGSALDREMTARLGASLAYVAQEPFVLEDTLRANLTWGCAPVTDEEIWRALDAVGAADLARGLAGGLDGSVRAGGSRFSGGERQRFRLAHALLRRPRLLVLDEATNALDLDAERAVLRGLRMAAPDATVLMVTHRPSTLDLADHVIMLERGRLAWSGPPGALNAEGRLRLAADQA